MKYILFTWPDSQEFMEEEWFQKEAILASTSYGPQAYLIPENRIQEEVTDEEKDYVLVTLNTNYADADEFGIDSYWVTSIEEYNDFLEQLKSVEDNINSDAEVYFGANEYISFSSFENICEKLTVTPITASEYFTITKYIGEEFGLIAISYLPEHYE